MTESIVYETTEEGIAIITINRPSVRNAVDHATSLKLADSFQKFERDDSQKVCLLTGAGTDFCAGYDLHQVATNTSGTLPVCPVDEVNGALGPMEPSRMQLSKPIIAAISGHAVAGGLELCLLADMRIVDTTAVFGVFCRRFGVPLIDGGTVRLPQVVGQGRAMDMILTGRPVDASEALAFGLANRVVPKGQALEAARSIARDLVGFPQKCLRTDLASTNYSANNAASLKDALQFEFARGAPVVAEESVQGAKLFYRGHGRGGSFQNTSRASDFGEACRNSRNKPQISVQASQELKYQKSSNLNFHLNFYDATGSLYLEQGFHMYRVARPYLEQTLPTVKSSRDRKRLYKEASLLDTSATSVYADGVISLIINGYRPISASTLLDTSTPNRPTMMTTLYTGLRAASVGAARLSRSSTKPSTKKSLLRRTKTLPCRRQLECTRCLSTQARAGTDSKTRTSTSLSEESTDVASTDTKAQTLRKPKAESAKGKYNLYGDDWEDSVDFAIQSFEDLPHRLFGVNQHMIINYELKEALRLMLRQFKAPIVYCFAYGSGVFPQGELERSISEVEFRAVHPKPPAALVKAQKGSPKMIDFIFGVSHTQHWHSINMRQHRNHYSGVASLGSGMVSRVQDWGAGVYFNPYIEMNGMLIKYGVTSIDNLVRDLSSWDNLYLAGRLQKPVKILRDHPQVRFANQHNLIAALRAAMLLLPADFSETEVYSTIAGLSYLGDPRMALPTENKNKVDNIVKNNVVHFRRLYAPLIKTLPNVDFTGACRLDDEDWVLNEQGDNKLQQDMDPMKRGNMVRRLPSSFRSRLYFQYQKKFAISQDEFWRMMKATSYDDASWSKRRQGGEFEERIAGDEPQELQRLARQVIRQTVNWPSTSQSIKGLVTGGWGRSWRYMKEKYGNWSEGKKKKKTEEKEEANKEKEKKKEKLKQEGGRKEEGKQAEETR